MKIIKARKIDELNKEELEKVFHKNKGLQRTVLADMLETEMSHYNEALRFLDESALCEVHETHVVIDPTLIDLSDKEAFIRGFKEIDKHYCMLPDFKAKQLINDMSTALDLYLDADLEETPDSELDRIHNNLDSAIIIAANALARQLSNWLDDCYHEEQQLGYFLDHFVHCYTDDSFYIDSEYNLFQTTTKSFS